MRARDAWTASSWWRTSAWSRSFSTASRTAAAVAAIKPGIVAECRVEGDGEGRRPVARDGHDRVRGVVGRHVDGPPSTSR